MTETIAITEARTILVCTANPSETARLRADEEVRSLTEDYVLGCYWIRALLPIDDTLQDLRSSCKATQHTIPQIQLAHATATATQGNFAAAQTLLQDAKQRDPSLDITQRLTNARRHASSSLLFKANRRVTLTSRDQLSADPQANIEKFDYLTQAYLNEANFLVRRAVTINPNLNLETELANVKQQWQKSIATIKPTPTQDPPTP